MYCDQNFGSKKSLKEAVARGDAVGVFQPGPFGSAPVRDGEHSVDGPALPEAAHLVRAGAGRRWADRQREVTAPDPGQVDTANGRSPR